MSQGNEFENVVVLKFDNADFEKKARESDKTLRKFDDSLQKIGKGKHFKNLTESANNLNLNKLSQSIDTVNKRFSLMGIVGATAIAKISSALMNKGWAAITAIPRQILAGGRQRALDIQQARFQLQGLFQDSKDASKKIKQVMEDADYAVTNTAYGLNEAAKAASQLAASGVKPGQQMKGVLKSITGLAAMTNSSFEDMSQIFTTIAGNGRIMGKELIQISSRGINAAQAITKYLNAHEGAKEKIMAAGEATGRNRKLFAELSEQTKWTERDIRSLVTAGVIDFQTFSDAMNYAFGDQAKRANETYTGSLANMKAALSRIGQGPMEAHLQNMTKIFNALRLIINGVNNATKPLQYGIMRLGRIGTNTLVGMLNSVSKALSVFEKPAKVWSSRMNDFLYGDDKKSKSAISNNNNIAKSLHRVAGASETVSKSAKNSITAMSPLQVLGTIFTNIAKAGQAVWSVIKKVFSTLWTIMSGFGTVVLGVGYGLVWLTGKLVEFIQFISSKAIGALDRLSSGFDKFVVPAIKSFTRKMVDASHSIIDFIKHSNRMQRLSTATHNIFVRLGATISQVWSNITSKIRSSANGGRLEKVKLVLEKLLGIVKELGGRALDAVISKFEKLGNSTKAFHLPSISNITGGALGALSKGKDFIKSLFGVDEVYGADSKEAVNQLKDSASDIADATNGAANTLRKANQNLRNATPASSVGPLNGLIEKLKGMAGGMANTSNSIKDGIKNATLFQKFTKVVGHIGSDLQSQSLSENIGNITKLGNLYLGFKFLKLMKKMPKVFDSISGMFNSLGELAKAHKKKVKYNSLKAIGITLFLFTASIGILSTIPAGKLLQSIGMMIIVIVSVMKLMKLVDKMASESNVNVKNIIKMTFTISSLGLSMLLLAKAAKLFGSMKVDELLKAGVMIGSFLAMIAGYSIFAKPIKGSTYIFRDIGVSLLAMSVSLLILKRLSWDDYAESVTKLSILVLGIIGASKIIKANKGSLASMVGLGLAVTLLTGPLIALSFIPFDKLMPAVAALTFVMFAVAGAARLAGESAPKLAGLVVMGGIIYAVATSLTILAFIPWKKLLIGTAALSTVILSLAAAGYIASSAMSGVITLGLMFGVLLAALYILKRMKVDNTVKTLSKLVNVSLKMVALSAAMALLGAYVGASLAGVIGFGAVIAATATVLAALGAISKIPGAKKLVDSGGKFLEKIGKAIGRGVGGILAGFKQAAGIKSAGEMAKDITKFIKSLNVLFQSVREMRNEGLDKPLSILTRNIKTLSSSTKSLAAFGGDKDKLVQFADAMKHMLSAFKQFAADSGAIKNLDKASKIAQAIGKLARAAKNIPNTNGLFTLFTGEKSLASFAKDLVGMAKHLQMAFKDAVFDDGMTATATNMASVISRIATVAKKLDGLSVKYTGDYVTPLKNFASDVKSAVPKFKGFAEKAQDLISSYPNFGSITVIVASAMTAIANLAKKLVGKRLHYDSAWVQPLTNFALDTQQAIPKFVSFANTAKKITPDHAGAIKQAAELMNVMAGIKLQKTSFLNGFFGGVKSLTGTARDLKAAISILAGIKTKGVVGKAAEIKNIISDLKTAIDYAGDQQLQNKSGFEMIIGFANGITSGLDGGYIQDALANLGFTVQAGFAGSNYLYSAQGTKAVDSYKTPIRRGHGLRSAGSKAGKLALLGFASYTKKYHSEGRNAMTGFANGITKYLRLGVEAAKKAARKALEGFRRGQDSNSPAKKYTKEGHNSIEGFVLGIHQHQKYAYSATKELAARAVSSFNDSMEDFGNEVYMPEIKPVLNLDNIESGVNKIADLMSNSNTIVTDGAAGMVSSAIPRSSKTWTPGNNAEIQNENSGVTFVQNNYSPKSLSRLEIYRNTRNLLETVKTNS